MKHTTKFIAALAVMTSFSSLAADPIVGLADVTDLAGAITIAGDGGTEVAAILQTGSNNFATIQQTGTNTAVIVQRGDDYSTSIFQTGTNNAAIILLGN
jgi:tRNA A22 N-methylase